MSEIVPAILADNLQEYNLQVEKVKTFAKRVHIDITDGEFAPSFTVSESELWWPESWEVDIHAMVARPSQYADALIALKPSMIIFHAEVEEDLIPTLSKIKQAGIKVGVALQKQTVPSSVERVLEIVDHAMIFSGNLGYYGGRASLIQVEKVRLIKKIQPAAEIGWDGGVAVSNALILTQSGVDVLNTGGAIQKADNPTLAYNELVEETQRRGVL